MSKELTASDCFDLAGGRGFIREVRKWLNEVGKEKNEWAGIPMPLESSPMVIHPKYPFAKLFDKESPESNEDEEAERFDLINHFRRKNVDHYVLKSRTSGKSSLYSTAEIRSLDLIVNTMATCDAWEIEPESKATQKLASLIDHRQFRSYMLTGAFFERSTRSNVPYIFRRLRPTIACAANCPTVKPLCGLCMHPIGYYKHTFAGSLVPTDDVIAHLLMMRGDERRFWKMCSQHNPHSPEAAIL